MTGRRLAVVAGSGSLPLAVAQAAQAAGWQVEMLPVEGFAARDFPGFTARPVSMFDPPRAEAALRESGAEAVVLVGGVHKPQIGALMGAWQAVRHREELRRIVEGGDDNVLRGVVRWIEERGLAVLGVPDVAPGLMAPQGPLTRRGPDGTEADIAVGLAALVALGPHDVGQAVIVARRRILAVEAVEGTDATLRRVALLRHTGALGLVVRRGRPPVSEGQGGVLVKAAKPGQDRRVDLPGIGARTVALAAAAGLDGIAVEAGAVLLADRERLIAEADRRGLFVVGVSP